MRKARSLLSRTKIALFTFTPGIRRANIKAPVHEGGLKASELRERARTIKMQVNKRGSISMRDAASLLLDTNEKYNLTQQQGELLSSISGMATGRFPHGFVMKKVKKALKTMSDEEMVHMQKVARPFYLAVFAPLAKTGPALSRSVKLPMQKFEELLGPRLKEIKMKNKLEEFHIMKAKQKPKSFVYHEKKGAMTRKIESLLKIKDGEMFAPELRNIAQSGEFNKKNLEFLFKVIKETVPKQLEFLPYYMKDERKLTDIEKKFFKEKGLL